MRMDSDRLRQRFLFYEVDECIVCHRQCCVRIDVFPVAINDLASSFSKIHRPCLLANAETEYTLQQYKMLLGDCFGAGCPTGAHAGAGTCTFSTRSAPETFRFPFKTPMAFSVSIILTYLMFGRESIFTAVGGGCRMRTETASQMAAAP